jgi:hypothetical protein
MGVEVSCHGRGEEIQLSPKLGSLLCEFQDTPESLVDPFQILSGTIKTSNPAISQQDPKILLGKPPNSTKEPPNPNKGSTELHQILLKDPSDTPKGPPNRPKDPT